MSTRYTVVSLVAREHEDEDYAELRLIRARAKADPRAALERLKGRLRTRRANLLDPRWNKGPWPDLDFVPGMTTAQYIQRFQAAREGYLNRTFALPLTFIHAEGRAPFHAPGDDEVLVWPKLDEAAP